MKKIVKTALGVNRPFWAQGFADLVSMELWTIASDAATGVTVVEAAERLLRFPLVSPVLREYDNARQAALRLLELELFGQ